MSNTYPPSWVKATVITGMIGIVCVAVVAIHSTWNLHKHDVGTKSSRALYILFFISSWITCFAFAFLRTDLILPMGHSIDCRIGFYSSTQGVFLAKIFLMGIFIYRIDLAFHSSALAYPRWVLGLTSGIYSILICALNVIYIKVTWKLINLASFEINDTSYGLCTSAIPDDSDQFDSEVKLKFYLLALMFLGDFLFSIFVCGLFVFKLNKVIKMMHDESGDGDVTLAHLTRKQTILVIVACITSLITLGTGSVVKGFSLLISIDLITNVICVGLMFTFSDKYWRFMVKRVCFCCYCCVFKEEFLVQMDSFSKKYSLRRDKTNTQRSVKNIITTNINISPYSDPKDKKKKKETDHTNNNNKPQNGKKESKLQAQSRSNTSTDVVNFNGAKDIQLIQAKQMDDNDNDPAITDDMQIKYEAEDPDIEEDDDCTTPLSKKNNEEIEVIVF